MLEKYSAFSEAVVECFLKQELKGFRKKLMALDLMALTGGEAEREMSNLGTDLNHRA
jgi:hypothetical protein